MVKSCSGLSIEFVESLKMLKMEKCLSNLSCLEQEDGADDIHIPSSNIVL